jgi:DNA mismatch endonuclease (patch repair protein)
MPKTRTAFWRRKLQGNVVRDEASVHRLKELGWRVIIVWECELNDEERLRERLVKAVEANAS